MDEIDRAQAQEEMAREHALAAARNFPVRDLEADVCSGCSYVTETNCGKRCDGWRECLVDLQVRERSR